MFLCIDGALYSLMLIFFIFSSLALILLLLLTLVSALIRERAFSSSREELSSYECGFEHHSLSRLPISLRYFMLTVVFLVFDMEIMLLSYYPLSYLVVADIFSYQAVFIVFVISLTLGLIFE